MVVAGYNENACHCHNDKGYGVAASKNEEHDGKQHRKAHRCHRHKADGEKNNYKDSKADQSRAPINEPHACKKGQHRFSALEAVPHGECVAKHTTKECGGRAKLRGSVKMSHDKTCRENGENGLANVNGKHAKGSGSKAMESFEIGKARVFAAKLADVLFIHQAREDHRAVNAAQQISQNSKGKRIKIRHISSSLSQLRFVFGVLECRENLVRVSAHANGIHRRPKVGYTYKPHSSAHPGANVKLVVCQDH